MLDMRIRISINTKEVDGMKNVKDLLEQRDALLDKLINSPLWVNGSVIESVRKYRGKEAPFYYLSQSIKGKNKITYVSAKQLDDFKSAADAGQYVKDLLFKLSAVNVKLLKAGYDND